jgi:hypothetical protein
MLYEKQAADLLAECEKLAGARLEGVRGNLRHAQSRAAAVWELLVLEAAGQIGRIKYEPLEGASPDIELLAEGGETLWIEAAYLYPRFWREERRSDALIEWVYEMAEHRAIEAFKLRYQFTGDSSNAAGPIRTVPHLDDRKRFFEIPKFRLSSPRSRVRQTSATLSPSVPTQSQLTTIPSGKVLSQEAAGSFRRRRHTSSNMPSFAASRTRQLSTSWMRRESYASAATRARQCEAEAHGCRR